MMTECSRPAKHYATNNAVFLWLLWFFLMLLCKKKKNKNTIGGWPQVGMGVSRQPPAPDNRAALQEHVLEKVLDQSVNLRAV